MSDITQINAQLWTGGGVNSLQDVLQLQTDGIAADLDLRVTDDGEFITQAAAQATIAYLYNPTEDDGQPKPVSWFATSWSWALPLLQRGATLLAHCDAGVNRGPSTAYFLLRAFWGISANDALALLKSKRPVVNVAYRADADSAITALGLG